MDLEVSSFLTLGFILLLCLQTPVFAKENKLKFCVVDSVHTHSAIHQVCDSLDTEKNKDFVCVIEVDRVSCIKHLLNGDVDFMAAEPEDLIVVGMTKENNQKVLVTQELRVYLNEIASVKMVVVAKKNLSHTWQTEKTVLCISGLEIDGLKVDDIRYFERQLLVPECDPRKTLLDNRMSALSNYFNSACIAGPWTPDKTVDAELKQKYSNLCLACQNPEECSDEDIHAGREGSLLCLTEGKGDVVWARAEDVKEHFQTLRINKEKYIYLCLNDSSRTLKQDPCLWLSKPWRTIIARKSVAERVSKFVDQQTVGTFSNILSDDLYRMPVLVDPLKTPNDFLEKYPEYYSLKDHIKCTPSDHQITWCVTTNLEYEKCQWLSNVARSRGIVPSIKCVQEHNWNSCIFSVRNCDSDIFVVKSIDETKARDEGLKPVVYVIPNTTHHENEIVALVKKFSQFESLEDLKHHTACFSGYRDMAWNAFIYIMRNLTGDDSWYCRDAEMVSQYFNNSCVVGLDDRNSTFPKNLYSVCDKVLYAAQLGMKEKIALSCLTHVGDVAFLNLDPFMKSYKETYQTYYRPICVDESTSDSKSEKRCFLTWTTLGSVMIHKDTPKMREQEIRTMLLELHGLFGPKFKEITPQMSMYGPFDGYDNIIFPNNTQTLEKYTDRIHRVPSYHKILDDIMRQRKLYDCSYAKPIEKPSLSLILISLLYLLKL